MRVMEEIKRSVFTGDHSSVYMLACGVGCITALISLIWWYNKMLNDPFGRLDVSAVIKSCAVLLLTCNFYSFVLMPTDYMVGLLTKSMRLELHPHFTDGKSGVRDLGTGLKSQN